jgi:hypothetical protein
MATGATVPPPPSDQAVSRTSEHRAGKEGLRPLRQCSGMSLEGRSDNETASDSPGRRAVLLLRVSPEIDGEYASNHS